MLFFVDRIEVQRMRSLKLIIIFAEKSPSEKTHQEKQRTPTSITSLNENLNLSIEYKMEKPESIERIVEEEEEEVKSLVLDPPKLQLFSIESSPYRNEREKSSSKRPEKDTPENFKAFLVDEEDEEEKNQNHLLQPEENLEPVVKPQFNLFGAGFTSVFSPSRLQEAANEVNEPDELEEDAVEIAEIPKDQQEDAEAQKIDEIGDLQKKEASTTLPLDQESKVYESDPKNLQDKRISLLNSNDSDSSDLYTNKRRGKRFMTDYSKYDEKNNVDLIKALEDFDFQQYEQEEGTRQKGSSSLLSLPFQNSNSPVVVRRKNTGDRSLAENNYSLPPEFCSNMYKSYKRREKSPLYSKRVTDKIKPMKDMPVLPKISSVKEFGEDKSSSPLKEGRVRRQSTIRTSGPRHSRKMSTVAKLKLGLVSIEEDKAHETEAAQV